MQSVIDNVSTIKLCNYIMWINVIKWSSIPYCRIDENTIFKQNIMWYWYNKSSYIKIT